jgi:hypothetical protein
MKGCVPGVGEEFQKLKIESHYMKICLRKFVTWFAVLAALVGVSYVGFAQPTLSITPSVISNTYPGVITLQITGLTNGETVNVHTFLDLNANGVADPGEPLMDAFKITDNGTNGIFGTVTNVNIPIDSNSATGAITTTLNFAPPLTLANIVGQQIFKVVSPTGRFSPVTATLKVTNAATAQSVSGTVFDGVIPVPNAVVVALLEPNTDYAGATVADNTGHYSLNLNPGTYALITVSPNYYTDQSLTPQVILTNPVAVTTNLFLTNGAVANTISGQVYDSVSSNGVGAVFLQLQSGNLFSVTFTDTNGNYSAAAPPAFWKIKPAKERLARRAYVVSQTTFQVDATAGSVTNANTALYKADALFYGRITDSSNAPLVNILFDGNDSNNQFGAKGYSDANGNYAVAVLGTTNDDWFSSANQASALSNYILNNFNSVSVSTGQLIHENFVALPITAHISGRVRDNSGNPVVGVTLYANTLSGNYQALNSSTDNSGNYSLGVASGSWMVGFSLGGEGGLDTAGFTDLNGPYNVSIPPTNVLLNLTVYPIGTPLISQPQHISATQFGFTINGALNVGYTVQVSTNLGATNWSSLFSLVLTNTSLPVVDVNATNRLRFYRVKKN